MRLLLVDAFAAEPFRGNPAAVCVLERDADDSWMAAVAGEMNLSETAFLQRRGDDWRLRWFTPVTEVDLCGHATLASAHGLWELGLASSHEPLRFHTRSGLLTAVYNLEGIRLDFPAEPAAPAPSVPALLDAIGVQRPVAFSRNRFDYVVEVADADQVRAVTPDMARLAAVETRGVVVTARSDTVDHDFISRWFGPRVGVPEDPVTGSAHCCLGPYWAERLGRTELRGYQASARGGTVGVRVRGGRVDLIGSAITVLRGELV